jgi:hypothetical protein
MQMPGHRVPQLHMLERATNLALRAALQTGAVPVDAIKLLASPAAASFSQFGIIAGLPWAILPGAP